MILSDSSIKAARARGEIVITPWDLDALGPNSYDVHLGPEVLVQRRYLANGYGGHDLRPLDAAVEFPLLNQDYVPIPPEGLVLSPAWLYLASTLEYTESNAYVPVLDGKSSVGRLGVRIHATAGRGDVGFKGHWTMEIDVVQPVRLYAGMPIGQLIFHLVHGEIENRYDKRPTSKYGGTTNSRPQASKMFKNFPLPLRCQVCGAVVREGLVVCSGLSPCLSTYTARR